MLKNTCFKNMLCNFMSLKRHVNLMYTKCSLSIIKMIHVESTV